MLEETIQPYAVVEPLYVPYSTHLRAVTYRQIEPPHRNISSSPIIEFATMIGVRKQLAANPVDQFILCVLMAAYGM